MPPFLSIGLTTHNRLDLLRQSLKSILSQSFVDYEIIIGNDFVDQRLTLDLLGIRDDRIAIVNNPINLGEVGNMQNLLTLARGRYFTWLGDDDLYDPRFLETVFVLLKEYDYPDCLFSAYKIVQDVGVPAREPEPEEKPIRGVCMAGRHFLRAYFEGKLKIIGVYGIFDRRRLVEIGGATGLQLCDAAVGLFGEYLLLARCGMFRKIIYVDLPLVVYRIHDGSWTSTSIDLDEYVKAGRNVIRECVRIFLNPALRDDARKNTQYLVRIVLQNLAVRVLAQSGHESREFWVRFVSIIRQDLGLIVESGLFRRMMSDLNRELNRAIAIVMLHDGAQCYSQNQFDEARKHYFSAVVRDVQVVRKPYVVSIMMELFVGRRIMGAFRRVWACVFRRQG